MSATGLIVASFFSAFRHFSDLGFIDIDPEKAGAPSVGPPTNGYVLENGVDNYVAEDGTTFYVQEMQVNKRTVPPPVPTPRSGSLKLSQIAPAGSIPVTGTQFVAVTGGAVDNLYTIDQIAGFVGAGSGAPPFIGTSKHGLPTHSDVPVGYWMVIKDTLNNTTGLYYNDAGVLEVVYLSNAPLPAYAPTYYIYGF